MRQELPSLTALQAFEAALRHQSFTRAAGELSRTQGAVSRQVSALESQLGVRLFFRVHPRVRPTPAGEAFGSKVRSILDRLAAAVIETQSAGEGGGVLNLAILPTFGTQWLIPRVRSFYAAHPGILVNFATHILPFDFDGERAAASSGAGSGEGIVGRSIDAAVHHGEPVWPGARLVHLMDEDVQVVCSPETAREVAELPGPAHLLGQRLLHLRSRPTGWTEWFAAQGVAPEQGRAATTSGPHFENHLMVIQAAMAGLGLALLPAFLVQTELRDGRLVTPFPGRATSTSRPYWLAYPERSAELPALIAFRAWLCERLEAEGLARPAQASVEAVGRPDA